MNAVSGNQRLATSQLSQSQAVSGGIDNTQSRSEGTQDRNAATQNTDGAVDGGTSIDGAANVTGGAEEQEVANAPPSKRGRNTSSNDASKDYVYVLYAVRRAFQPAFAKCGMMSAPLNDGLTSALAKNASR